MRPEPLPIEANEETLTGLTDLEIRPQVAGNLRMIPLIIRSVSVQDIY